MSEVDSGNGGSYRISRQTRYVGDGGFDVDLGGVRSKKVKVVQGGVVRATKTNDDQTDEGGDSTYHGQSDDPS